MLASPELHGLENAGRRYLNCFVRVAEIGAEPLEFVPVEEHILLSYQVAGGEEVLAAVVPTVPVGQRRGTPPVQ